MQRKATKNTRGPNADEKAFMAYTKECRCIVCGHVGPSIVDHALGSTFKHRKTLVGHWFLLPLCSVCDGFKSAPNGSTSKFIEMCGMQLCELWDEHQQSFEESQFDISVPCEVRFAIMDWGR